MFIWVAWFPMLVLAIINGIARNILYKNKVGDLRAHQISTFTLIVLIATYIYFLNMLWPFRSGSQALLSGIVWVIMTIIFEFGFGHFIMKNPIEKLLRDYNILKGHLWGLFLLFLLLLPWFIHSTVNK